MVAHLVDTATARLQTLANQNPGLALAVEYYRYLLPAFIAAEERIPPLSLPAEIIAKKLNSGSALLVDEECSIDPNTCREIFLSLSRAARQGLQAGSHYTPSRSGVNTLHIDRIIANTESGQLVPLALLSATSANRNDVVKETAARLDLDARLLELLVNYTLKAFLHAWRSSLQSYTDVDTWQRSYCPFCGNPPALAEIQGVERSRYLRCLQCGSRWPYPNLECAFCGNSDYHSLGIIQLENEAHKYYAHTCNCCRRYIKTVATFEPIPTALLPAEDLATLHLDSLAMEKGYK